MIGLKRGTVMLRDHQREWEIEAQQTIIKLKTILGDTAKRVEHVGSKAKEKWLLLSSKRKP